MNALLRLFFKLLYHQFAFAYDLVAATVSCHHWKGWLSSVIPFIEGTRILEIGHGPGHLQRILLSRHLAAVGIDESAQMGRLANRNTKYSARLTRCVAQRLPFADASFETIVSTFPSEYIFDPHTLAEGKRCLSDGGRLIVLPVALPTNRFLNWLYKITSQAHAESIDVMTSKLNELFGKAGFMTEFQMLDVGSGLLLILVAKKEKKRNVQ